MRLPPGTHVGPYEIQAPLGAGGMGEVYRGRDARLQRDVALKVLPADWANDADRLARFRREAQILALLNHPNIAAIYGLEESDGIVALVLELVDGPTVADRLSRGALPLAEALGIGRAIADALEAAHQNGVVHRDLKPGNVKLRSDGTVKVLDFGLAKVFGGAPSASDNAVTLTSPLVTRAGMVLGTASYMSPEQSVGQEVDRTADIWAFGCVVFEMLTGRRAFPGDTISDAVAAVLKQEPDWSALPAETPESVRRLLRRCLQKERVTRLRDIADARLEIDDARNTTVAAPQAVRSRRAGPRERMLWIAALLLTAAAAGAAIIRALPTPVDAPETHVDISGPLTPDRAMALSPDGQQLVFVGQIGTRQLWLRSLDAPAARPLAGTDGASGAFWSPDGRAIAFWADRRLKRLDLQSGMVQTIAAAAPAPLAGTWNRDDVILFAPSPGQPLARISAAGGEVVPVTRLDPSHRGHLWPQFLPDQRRFVFFVAGDANAQGVYAGHLESSEITRLFPANGPAVFLPPGYLVFIRDGKLFAHVFDPENVRIVGDPFPVDDQLEGITAVTAAARTIAYRTQSADPSVRQFVWYDRSGKELDRVEYSDTMSQGPALSHDGRRIAVFRSVKGNVDIWIYETTRRTWDRVTFHRSDEILPLWSPDSRRIAYASRRGLLNVYWKLLDGPAESEELLYSSSSPSFPMDWSRDGRFLLFDALDPQTADDIWVLALDASRKASVVLQTPARERLAQFSPDSQWIAYESDKTGRVEVYVRPFPGPGAEIPVSVDGGAQVRWNPNGRELFYLAADDRMMAVPVRMRAEAVELGTAVPLFATTVASRAINTNRQLYVVGPDGQSFVMNSIPEDSSPRTINLILNWQPAR